MRGILSVLGVVMLLASARGDAEGDAKAVLDFAINAHGGANKIGQHKALVVKMRGKVEINGQSFAVVSTTSTQGPGRARIETEVEVTEGKFTSIQVVDRDKGWHKVGDRLTDLDKDKLTELREQVHAAALACLSPLRERAYRFAPLGEINLDGKELVGVQVTLEGRRDVNLYFDKKSGLLIKSETRAKEQFNGNQEFTAEIIYSEYREFDGVQRPTKHVLRRDGKTIGELDITSYEGLDKLDEAVFARP